MKFFPISVVGITIALLAASPSVSAEKPVVAVMPFGSPNNHNFGAMGKNAQPTFTTQFVKSGKVRVVNERLLQKAMGRFQLKEAGLMDPKEVKKVGKFMKADYVLTGALTFVGDAYTMTTHLTNVETLEIELADDVDFRNTQKFRVAVRTAAQKMLALITGEAHKSGKHEAFLNINPRHFYDTADACIKSLRGLGIWRYEGEVDEELGGKKVHVKLRQGTPKKGMPLQVFEEGLGSNDKPIGVVYVVEPDEKGSGFIAKWIKEKDKSKRKRGDFGLGARVSNLGYKYRIAIGAIDDEAEDNEALVKMFKDKMLESLEESDQFIGKSSAGIDKILLDLGRGKSKKKKLKKLHLRGVDFVVLGKFIGDPGRRRADFKILSAMTGKLWGKLEFETRI